MPPVQLSSISFNTGERAVSSPRQQQKQQQQQHRVQQLAPLGHLVSCWNNISLTDLVSMWKLYVLDHAHAVGHIPDRFATAATWDKRFFQVDVKSRTIRLAPRSLQHHQTQRQCRCQRDPVLVCNSAIVTFCEQNRDVDGFRTGLEPWLRQNECFNSGSSGKLPDYHPILTQRPDLEGLKLPSPIRGILGIVTAGIHLNVYTMRGSGVDKIWVSRRGPRKPAYPSCYDQIVAGGMDPADRRSPWRTLCHELLEEAGCIVHGRRVYRQRQGGQRGRCIGEIESSINTIYFRTEKDGKAGPAEDGHIEPGLRFCFDLCLGPGEMPEENEANMKFSALSVDEVRQSLESLEWKPNSGLVTLNFLLRKGLIESPADCKAINSLAREDLALQLPEFVWD